VKARERDLELLSEIADLFAERRRLLSEADGGERAVALGDLSRRLAATDRGIQEASAALEAARSRLAEAEARAARLRARIRSLEGFERSSGAGPRQLEAAEREIAAAAKELESAEETGLAAIEEQARLEKEIEGMASRRREMAAELQRLGVESEGAAQALRLRLEELASRMEHLIEQLPDGIRAEVREALSGAGCGLARLEGTSCSACGIEVPHGVASRYRRHGGEIELSCCEECGAILVP
jgi:predicted  nucleic acid-binding Zn-ribbon protein